MLPLAQNGNPHLVDFSALLVQHGVVPAAVASSELSQRRRFDQLLKVLPDNGVVSLLDVGCGYGALVPYLVAQHPDMVLGHYVGLDIFPEMLHAARTALVSGSTQSAGVFEFHQVTDQDDPLSPFWTPDRAPEFDYVYISGVITYAWSHESGFRLMQRAFQLCRKVLVLNGLSTWAPHETSSNLHYRPGEVLDRAGLLSRWVSLDHAYLPHDWTVTIWRTQPFGRP